MFIRLKSGAKVTPFKVKKYEGFVNYILMPAKQPKTAVIFYKRACRGCSESVFWDFKKCSWKANFIISLAVWGFLLIFAFEKVH